MTNDKSDKFQEKAYLKKILVKKTLVILKKNPKGPLIQAAKAAIKIIAVDENPNIKVY